MRRSLAWVALGAGLALAAPAPAEPAPDAAQAEARAVVGETVDGVLAVLRDDALSDDAKLERVIAVLETRFDFALISKLVLARNYRRFSPEQREQFTEEFRRHLSLTYGKSLKEYTGQEVELTDTRMERNGDVTVRTRLVESPGGGSGGDPVLIDYRMRSQNGSWHVIDVIIEGVSLLFNFRSQTQEVISERGAQGLIDTLREKNLAGDTGES